ncbi:helix-turn-helix transcriptional regulator [Stenotrophomonas acidaminiphila]|uniref:helix-turn-helix transcriptional regulator n=1 Tax=Stenotrophomonas acidaminiphila TaxID=128780 RepID=UPI0028A61523|nr:AlpA family phage regulatory protein [Stenotrophomonas acidaminiphila]
MADEIALWPLKEVKLRVGLSTATIYRMMAKGLFPKPRKIGTKSLWFSPEIEEFILAVAAGKPWSPNMGQNMGQDVAA